MIVKVCLLWCHQKKLPQTPRWGKKGDDFALWYIYFPVLNVFFCLFVFNIIQQELNVLFPGYLRFSWLIKYFINKDMAMGRMCDLKKKNSTKATFCNWPRLLCSQRAPMQMCLSLELSKLSVEILDLVILIRFMAGPADLEHLLPSQCPQLARCTKHSNRHKTKRKSTTNFMWTFPPGCQLSLCVLDPLHSRQWTFISLIVHRALLSL